MNLANFCPWYEFSKKGKEKKSQSSPDEDDDIGNNDQQSDDDIDNIQGTTDIINWWIPLKNNAGYIKKQNKAKIIKYYRPNAQKNPKLYFYSIVMLYLPWLDQKKRFRW